MNEKSITLYTPLKGEPDEYEKFIGGLNSLISNKRKGVTFKRLTERDEVVECSLEADARGFAVLRRSEYSLLIDSSGYEKDLDSCDEPLETLEARWNTKDDYDHEPILVMNGLDYIDLEHKEGSFKDYAGVAHYHDGSKVEIEIIQNK